MIIAVATEENMVAQHFGRCPEYTLFKLVEGAVSEENVIPNPGHEPGFLPGYLANLAVLDNLTDCRVTRVYKEGELVGADGICTAPEPPPKQALAKLRSSVNVQWLEPDDLVIQAPKDEGREVRVIEVIPDQLRTRERREKPTLLRGHVVADPDRDLLKLAVIERHAASGNIGLGLVRGFGLKRGAIASSVAHDAHNLIVVGVSDHDMMTAAVHLVKIRGGLCVVAESEILADLPLPIAGLLSSEPALVTVEKLLALRAAAYSLGCGLDRPFMTLSFMSLSVIGDLRLTDGGLVDVAEFKHVDLFV